MAGVLLDLAEGRQQLTIRMTSGRLVRGSVELVALDAVALRTGAGHLTLLRLDAIVWVRRVPGQAGEPATEPAGARPAARPATFAALAAGLAAERPQVSLAVAGEASLLTGELRSVGVDVLTVRLDGAPPVSPHISPPLRYQN